MKNVAFGVLATLFIAGCGTVGGIDAGRDSMAKLPGWSDMYLMERKVRNLKYNAAYVGEMLSRVGADNYSEQIDRISGDSRSLRQIVDRLSLDMQGLVFELEEQDRLRIKEKDDKTLSRMKSLMIPDLKIGAGKSLKDAADILRDAARHPKHGESIEIEFNLDDVALGWEDNRHSGHSADVVKTDESDEGVKFCECVHKMVPIINETDISFYDALKLVCESVECSWDLRDGTIYVSLVNPMESQMFREEYPAPFFKPDRDWVAWFEMHGTHMPPCTKVVYNRVASKLVVTTTRKGIEMFEKAFPLIYSDRGE